MNWNSQFLANLGYNNGFNFQPNFLNWTNPAISSIRQGAGAAVPFMPYQQEYGIPAGPTGTRLNLQFGGATMAPLGTGAQPQAQVNNWDNTLGAINAGIQGVGALGNLWLGWEALQDSKKSASWMQGMAERNYANTLQSYNDAVKDKISGRYAYTTESAQKARDEEIARRQLTGGNR